MFVFGIEPHKGIHSIRFLGLAIVDVILTVIAAWALSHFTRVSMWVTVPALFGLGIIVHKALGIKTTLNRLLFDPSFFAESDGTQF